MKLRKLSEQRESKILSQVMNQSPLQYPSTKSPKLATMNAGLGQSFVHLPIQLAQNSYIMNNIPSNYTPVMHPVRFVNNEGFSDVISSRVTYPNLAEQSSIDWSKHPYTPLEITGTYEPASYSPYQNQVSEPDWRDQIYYWVGNLTYDDASQNLLWKGRWIGSFSGKPSAEEFNSGSNEFYYTSSTVDRNKVVVNDSAGLDLLLPVSGMYKGYYMMENNEGESERYNDKEFAIEFESVASNTPVYNVIGKGDSEFGVFILNGTYDARSKVLDMCRQYIADSDIRTTMSIAHLKQYFQRVTLQNPHQSL